MLTNKNYYLLKEYFKTHPDTFKKYEEDYILWYTKTLEERESIPYFILEIYDELGILPASLNVYDDFFNHLNETFPVSNRHILEVGGGIIPSLGKRISLNQNNGSMTIYDPRLSKYIPSNSSFIIKRKKFSKNTEENNVDLIIGLKPCEATEDIINWAISTRTDFMIGLCDGGLHGEPYDYFEDSKEWLKAMYYLATRGVEKQNMGKIKVKRLSNCDYNYPIIYNKR